MHAAADAPQASGRIIRAVFVGSLLIPIGLTIGVATFRGYDWPAYTGLLIAYTLVGHGGIPLLARRGRSVTIFLSLAVLNVLLLTPELALREMRFHYELGVQFAYPRPKDFQRLLPDPDVFWTLPPKRGEVNSLGFRGAEWLIRKPHDVYRVMFLGDSVLRTYPAMVELFLDTQGLDPRRFESANLSIEGYSSHQGRVLADRYGEMLEPDLVLVSYGWNDHWQAYGSSDSRKRITVDPSLMGRFVRIAYRDVRLLQLLRYVLAPLLGTQRPLAIPRVSLEEYRDNLSYIGGFFEARNVPVIFITPPTTHDLSGVPDYLVDSGFAASKDSVIALHHAYNETIRDITASHHWLLLDLAREAMPPEVAKALFSNDGIHLTMGGSAVMARRIADFVAAHWNACHPHRAERQRGPARFLRAPSSGLSYFPVQK